jgi:hypothetical protein
MGGLTPYPMGSSATSRLGVEPAKGAIIPGTMTLMHERRVARSGQQQLVLSRQQLALIGASSLLFCVHRWLSSIPQIVVVLVGPTYGTPTLVDQGQQ